MRNGSGYLPPSNWLGLRLMPITAPFCKDCPTFSEGEWNTLSDAKLDVLENSKKHSEYRRGEVDYA